MIFSLLELNSHEMGRPSYHKPISGLKKIYLSHILSVFYLDKKDNLSTFRKNIVVIISKKKCSLATHRNKIKRWIYESFRKIKKELNVSLNDKVIVVFFLLKIPKDKKLSCNENQLLNYHLIEQELRNALEKLLDLTK